MRHLEVYVEGAWLRFVDPPPGFADIEQAYQGGGYVLTGGLVVDHPKLGRMMVVPRSFPIRLVVD